MAVKKRKPAKKKPAKKKTAKKRATKKTAKKRTPKKRTTKKRTTKKRMTKKRTTKKRTTKKRTAKKRKSVSVSDAIASLREWADSSADYVLKEKPPARDKTARLRAPKPWSGSVPKWKLPPSYAEFLGIASKLVIKWGPNLGHEEFVVLDPRGIKSWSGIVYLPGDIMKEEGWSTNHLVPFASAGNDECAFCFDVSVKTDEYPVYFHHQDEPRIRTSSGAWLDPENETPDFESFAHWLSWVAEELSSGRTPAASYPSAYYKMPGRKP